MTSIFPSSDSIFRLLVSAFCFVVVRVLLWSGELTTFFVLVSWYCTETLQEVTCCCPRIQLSGVSHVLSATLSVCPCHCFGIVFICGSLLGPKLQPLPRSHCISAWWLLHFAFDNYYHVNR